MDVQDFTHIYYIIGGGIALGVLLWLNETK